MPGAAEHLRSRIAAEGPLGVADFMADALAHPEHGYYTTRDPLGADGDFITAPEVSQMFGELLGLWCAVQWQAMGAPAPVELVELGPGRGTLMADALRAALGVEGFAAAARVSLIEISPVLRARQERTLAAAGAAENARRVQWLGDVAEVPEGPLLLIANEFFDALPVRQFVATDSGWRERLVGLGADGGFEFVLSGRPPEAGAVPPGFDGAGAGVPMGAPVGVPVGAIVETRPEADAMVRQIAHRLVRFGGAALIVDYGHARSAAGDTLQSVSGHDYADPLIAPGTCDLTAHVDFAALAAAAADSGAAVHGPVSQGAFLLALGIEARAGALRASSPAHGSEIALALDRLVSADGMGRLFNALALTGPALAPPPGFAEAAPGAPPAAPGDGPG